MKDVSSSKKAPFNLSEFTVGRKAIHTPDAIALKIISNTPQTSLPDCWTYSDLDLAIRSIANGLLNKGLHPGDFLPLRLRSDTPFALTFFGAIAAGIIPIPLSPGLTANEVSFFLKDTGAKHCAVSANLKMPTDLQHPVEQIHEADILSFRQKSHPLAYAKTREDDPAFLIYSSGTTGKPKGVLHAQRVIKGRLPMQAGWHQMNEEDIVLHAGEFNWTYTLGVGLMDPWLWGATALIYSAQSPKEKTPDLWPELIKTHGATIFAAVPGVYRQILKYAAPTPEDLKNLRHGLTAGEALNDGLHNEWQKQTDTKLYEALGQSEISTYVSTTIGTKHSPKAKGRIQKGRTVTILKEETVPEKPIECTKGEKGLIAVHKSDPGLMLKYWNRPEEMKNAFCGDWFITGDRGIIDENNYLTHLGRADDVMNAQGYRVSPQEIETVLTSHKEIAEAAVFENQIHDDLSIIVALLVLKDETLNKTNILDDLKTSLNDTLAPYKHPKSFHFIKKLPRNLAGKLIRKDLKTLDKR
jgi:acyl-coenzyme A synthetase/AMP-(fatty) acid ligase